MSCIPSGLRNKPKGGFYAVENGILIIYNSIASTRQIKFRITKIERGRAPNAGTCPARAYLFVAANCLIDHDWIKAIFADEVKYNT